MKTYKAIYFFIILLFTPTILTSTWKINLEGKERSYSSINCVDEMNCVATCYSQLKEFNYKDSAYIIKTTNGGITWVNIYYKLEVNGLDTLGIFNCSEIAYPSTSTIIASSNYGVIIKSTDNGKTWKYSIIEKQLNIEEIQMSDEKNGWLHGYKSYWVNNLRKLSYFLYKTNDTWETWELSNLHKNKNIDGVITMATPSKNLVVISAFKDDSCYLYRSIDNGETWSQSPWTLDIENFYFLNDSIGFCAGGSPVEGGLGYSDCREIIYKTTNGGASWFLLRDTINDQHAGLRFIRFFDEKHGIACGYDKILIKTNDSGKTWHYESIGTPGTYTTVLNVAYPSKDRAFAILALEDLWINDEMTGVEDFVCQSNNLHISPNPATDYIEISYSPLEKGVRGLSEQIRIYNVFGQEINPTPTLSMLGEGGSTPSLLRNATPQEGNLKIDVSFLSPGLYFVRVGERVGKFVKI